MSTLDEKNTWSTPKKTEKRGEDRFVALTPQNATINTVLHDNEERNPEPLILATPYPSKKSSKTGKYNIYSNGSVQNIHREATLKQKNYSPFIEQRYTLLEAPSNHKSRHPKKALATEHYKHIDLYTQQMSPVQAVQCHDLFTAKDEIIEQKDVIMQKQKQIIIQLRQTNMELEELLIQKQHEIQSQANNERFVLHLQEYQYQVQQLKQQLTEATHAKQAEIEKLQNQLGEKEYENGKLEIALKEFEINSHTGVSKLKHELDTETHKLQSEHKKSEQLVCDLNSLRLENQKFQSYLKELPTQEEFNSLQCQVKKLQIEKDKILEKKELIHKHYKETKNESLQKDSDYKKLQKKCLELQDDVNSLKSTLEKYRERDQMGPVLLEEYEALKDKIEEFKLDKENLKQSLDKRHKKMKVLHNEMTNQQKQHNEDTQQLEEQMQFLKNELENKNVTVTQLTARSQELLETSLDLQTELKKYKDTYTESYVSKMTALFKEISQCSEDVKSFVNLCLSRMKGNDPSLHALLGLTDSPEKSYAPLPGASNIIGTNTVDLKLEAVVGIRNDIAEVRHIISEQYAQELGDNMCVTQ